MTSSRPIAIAVLVCLVSVLGLYFSSQSLSDRYQESAENYLRAILPDIAEWQGERVWPLFTAEAQQTFTPQQLDALLKQYQPLGEFRTIENIEPLRLSAMLAVFSGDQPRLSYRMKTRFEQGEAELTMTLVATENRYQLYNFSITSPAIAR